MTTKGKKAPLASSRTQRPQPRAKSGGVRGKASGNWSDWRPYLPTIGLGAACVFTLVLLVVLYYAATGSAFFQLREVVIKGHKRTTAEEIRGVVQKQVAASGVWHADLDTIRGEVQKLPWVKQVTIARVLPDSLRVQITEREKSAVILSNNKLMWADSEGVRLGPYLAADKVPNLVVLKGWDESDTPLARETNKQRVQLYHEILAQLTAKGLTGQVSELDLSQLNDARAALRKRPEVPIMLGDRNWGQRLADAVQALRDERQAVESVDTKLDNGNVIVAAPAAPVKEDKPNAGNRTRPSEGK